MVNAHVKGVRAGRQVISSGRRLGRANRRTHPYCEQACHKGAVDFTPHKHGVKWTFMLTDPLRPGEEFEFEFRYHVGAGGVKTGKDRGEFFYEQKKYPMKELFVSVRLTDTSTYILNPDGSCPRSRTAARSTSVSGAFPRRASTQGRRRRLRHLLSAHGRDV